MSDLRIHTYGKLLSLAAVAGLVLGWTTGLILDATEGSDYALQPKSPDASKYVHIEGAPLAVVTTPPEEYSPWTEQPRFNTMPDASNYGVIVCFEPSRTQRVPLNVRPGGSVWDELSRFVSCAHPALTGHELDVQVLRRLELLRQSHPETDWDNVPKWQPLDVPSVQ